MTPLAQAGTEQAASSVVSLVAIGEYLGIVSAFSILLWAAAEAIGAAFGLKKTGIALLLGPAGGLAMHGVGWLTLPVDGVWSWVMAGLTGLCCTVIAGKGINDQIVNRFFKRQSGGNSPPSE